MEIIKVEKAVAEVPVLQENSAVTIGKFDGLHRGHMLLINEAVSKKFQESSAAVVAFSLVEEDALLTEDERIRMLENVGVDRLIILPYSKEIFSMEAEDFVEELLIKRLKLSFLTIGEDFCFGRNRRGNAELLRALSTEKGFSLSVHSKVVLEDEIISSSAIKDHLKSGEAERANEMLGYAYAFSGAVIHGKALGRTLGFPTLNVQPAPEKLLPAFGVYHAGVFIDGKMYHGVMNLGVRPTVDGVGNQPLIEVYLLDADGDFYGENTQIQLLSFLRPEKKFESLAALKTQVLSDIETIREEIQEGHGLS